MIEDDPLWYKDAIIYELHVKAFYDSAGDGIGDFKGLTSKLDYLKELGVTAVWLLPFYPSPLKDDGYDISDYYDVNRLYGNLDDFRGFLREAHKRGIRVITELVLNHTSDQHPWFIQSKRALSDSKLRDFYVWSNTPDKYKDARIIFRDFETSNWTYDPIAKAYYWHRFYSFQPDLNYDNPALQEAMNDVVGYWLRMGVDGLRFDAVPYLFEREGTNCENLPETHEFLKQLRTFVDSQFKNKMLLAEANQWPADAAAYFGNGDECHMIFHFPLMPRMFMAIQMEDSFPIIDILEETPKPPDDCQHALFLRNHDELTLEMVTDEERDYMYRVYAKDKQARINLGIRRRLAPLLGNDRRQIELMNVMLFTLPGTPVIYYGDEIGMGDNFYLGDRNGVRTPMQWSADLNAGFSRTNPQKLYLPVIIEPQYHYEAINVDNQQNDSRSLMWWMKKLIATRKQYKALSRGSVQFLVCENPRILSFVRVYNDEALVVILNLSKNPQSAELDLSKYNGYTPRDVFSGTPFPTIRESMYRLTFGSHDYYVFALTKPQSSVPESKQTTPEIRLKKRFQDMLSGKAKEQLELQVLPQYLRKCRWFGGKGRVLERLRIRDVVELEGSNPTNNNYSSFMIIDVYYSEGLPEAYLLPVKYLPIDKTVSMTENARNAVIAKVTFERSESGLIFDAVYDPDFSKGVLQLLAKRSVIKGGESEIFGIPSQKLEETISSLQLESSKVRLLGVEQSNSSNVFDDQLVLKTLRKVEEGVNPEVEIGEVLSKQSYVATPPFLGHIEYRATGAEPATIGILQGYVRNQGDGWGLFTGEFQSFIQRIPSSKGIQVPDLSTGKSILELSYDELPEKAVELMTPLFVEKVRLLGQRTAEFHLSLSREVENTDFAPEQFGYLKQVAISQSMISFANRVFKVVAKSNSLKGVARQEIEGILFNQDVVTHKFEAIRHMKIDSVLMRVHGDYHLGQVLYTGKDFSIIDYEGEPSRSLSDRRLKRSPLRDVAGMIRSFQYVTYSRMMENSTAAKAAEIADEMLWSDIWYKYVSSVFLRSYTDGVSVVPILPKERGVLSVLFDAYFLEKAVYELWYEFNNRPDWVLIPLKGIKEILGTDYHSPQSN